MRFFLIITIAFLSSGEAGKLPSKGNDILRVADAPAAGNSTQETSAGNSTGNSTTSLMTKLRAADDSAANQFAKAFAKEFDALKAQVNELSKKVVNGDNQLIPTVKVRLLDLRHGGSSTRKEGRLEVWRQGEWGTVCDNEFDTNDAYVVCKTLGWSGGAKLFSEWSMGINRGSGQKGADKSTGQMLGMIGSNRIWLSRVGCTNGEESFMDCEYVKNPNYWGAFEYECSHDEDVFMKCS